MDQNMLQPPEAWDAAEEQIEVWREDRAAAERKRWQALNGY